MTFSRLQEQQIEVNGRSITENDGIDQAGRAEVIEIYLKSIPDAVQMARGNEISDAPSALAILLCEERPLSLNQ